MGLFFNTVNLNHETFNSNGDQVSDISKVGDRIYGVEVYSESITL